MKLWLLQPVQGLPKRRDESNPWEPWYDKAFGFVVRAETEADARAFASQHAGDEGKTAWLNDALSTCEELSPSGAAGVVLQDFHAA